MNLSSTQTPPTAVAGVGFKTTLIHTCKESKPPSRIVRSDIYWFAEICNSQCLSHFAASFIASRAEVSIVKGMFEMLGRQHQIACLLPEPKSTFKQAISYQRSCVHYRFKRAIVHEILPYFLLRGHGLT